jgi:hypothetical protein
LTKSAQWQNVCLLEQLHHGPVCVKFYR